MKTVDPKGALTVIEVLESTDKFVLYESHQLTICLNSSLKEGGEMGS